MGDWMSGDVVANGIRIHYYRTGGQKPPLVLSHGFSDSGLCWTRVARALEADYDVIMPDARGHGRSEAPDDGYNAEERARDLAGLIEALGLGRAAIGGHSMGAATTLYCAALRPDLVRCAILEDGGFRSTSPTGGGFNAARMAETQQRAREQRAMSREALIARCRAQSPTWHEDELGPWADAKIQLSEKAIGWPLGAEKMSWQEALAKVSCPILLITADIDKGSSVTPETAELARSILPSLQVVHLAGAGHNVRRERFDGYVAAVREFLAKN